MAAEVAGLVGAAQFAIHRSRSSANPAVLQSVLARSACLLLAASSPLSLPPSEFASYAWEPAFLHTVMLGLVLQVMQLHAQAPLLLLLQLHHELCNNDDYDLPWSEFVLCMRSLAASPSHLLLLLDAVLNDMCDADDNTTTPTTAQEDALAIRQMQRRLALAGCRLPMRDCSVLLARRFLEYDCGGEPCSVRTALILSGSRPRSQPQPPPLPQPGQLRHVLLTFQSQLQRFDPALASKLDSASRPFLYDGTDDVSRLPDLHASILHVLNTYSSGEEKRSRALFALEDFTRTALLLGEQQQQPVAAASRVVATASDVAQRITTTTTTHHHASVPHKRPSTALPLPVVKRVNHHC